MSEFNGTPHNAAKLGDIAKTVLMPGDPLRAKWIAETFLEDAKCFNTVRGMLGYTGKYKGVEVSVMGSGMGIPSIGIYSYELYNFYGVENIIRVGSTGGMPTFGLKLFDVILVDQAYSASTYAREAFGYTEDIQLPSEELNAALEAAAKELGKDIRKGTILSADNFYGDPTRQRYPEGLPVMGAEMESFGLFANARQLGKKGACLLSVSDIFGMEEETTAEQRQTGFVDMMEIALEAAIKL